MLSVIKCIPILELQNFFLQKYTLTSVKCDLYRFSVRWCEKTWANILANQIFHWGAFKTQIYSASFPPFVYAFSIHTHTHIDVMSTYCVLGTLGARVVFTKQLSGVRRHLSGAEGRSQPEPEACPVWWAQPGRWHPAATPGSPCWGPCIPMPCIL